MRTSPKPKRATDQSTVLQRNVLARSTAIFSDVALSWASLVECFRQQRSREAQPSAMTMQAHVRCGSSPSVIIR